MSKKILGTVGFAVLLALYSLFLTAIATFLPSLAVGAMLVWMVARRPLLSEHRLEHDIEVFRKRTSAFLAKALRLLIRPIRGGWS